jgi:small subunit ribosomal protein S4e
MLDKLTGVYAPRPSTGPHKLRECLPLVIVLKDRLKYALTATEVKKIVRQREGLIKVDGRVRRDASFPCGFMDVISCDKTGEHFRLLFDVKGRYQTHKITPEEATYKLCKVTQKAVGPNKAPYIVTHDGRTIRYPHPDINIGDTIKFNLETSQIDVWYKFEQGATVFLYGGKNIGRIGTISHVSKHDAGLDIVHVRDARNKPFATRATNVFVIGNAKKSGISLPKGKGLRYTIIEERDMQA